MTAASAPPLSTDLEAGLRRLKLSTIRRQAPEVCQIAKVQRWAPEDLLRTLVEAEIAAREQSNLSTKLKLAGFPVVKSLDGFQVNLSSVPQTTFDYLATLEWVRAHENVCLIGPAGTGKSHLLVGLGHAAVAAGHRVRYFAAADLVEALYRGLADNSVGRVVDQLLRADLVIVDELGFAPLDLNGPTSCSGSWPPPGSGQPLAIRPMGTLPPRADDHRLHARPPAPSCRDRGYQRRVLPDVRGQDQPRCPCSTALSYAASPDLGRVLPAPQALVAPHPSPAYF